MNISDFRAVAEMRNASVYLDTRTEEVKVRHHTLFNRAVTWLKEKISPNPMAPAERDAAHNRFLRAIADYSGYDSGDVSRAEALLSVDVLERTPLSSRRVREVIQDLDQRSTEAMRNNRTTVAWMTSRGVDLRLGEQSPETNLSEPERETLAARIDEAIHEAGRDGQRNVEYQQASAITNRLVDELLEAKAEQARAAAQARTQAEAARARRAAEAAERADQQRGNAGAPAARPPGTRNPAGPAPTSLQATASASGREPAPPKELRHLLGKAKLPRAVNSQVKKLIKSGAIADKAGLARRANAETANWVMENRVGLWYGEAQQRLGARGRIRNGEMLMASETMLRQVTRTITGSEQLMAFSDVEAQARELIAAHVRSEIDLP